MRIKLTIAAAAIALLCQCGYFPTLPVFDETTSHSGEPRLVPIDQLLAEIEGQSPQARAAALRARVAALQSKARALQAPVLSAKERRRLLAALKAAGT